jgi:ribosomal-protein-alanine N-acetyltransferase
MAIARARAMQAREMFLEVDVASSGAVALYTGLGFVQTGLRRGYYDRGEAGLADALVMRLDLTAAPN